MQLAFLEHEYKKKYFTQNKKNYKYKLHDEILTNEMKINNYDYDGYDCTGKYIFSL